MLGLLAASLTLVIGPGLLTDIELLLIAGPPPALPIPGDSPKF
jgi:hypothetical protein